MVDPIQSPFDHRPHVKGRRLNILPDNPDVAEEQSAVGLGRFPKWLHRSMPATHELWNTQEILHTQRLPTVCEEAKCPNLLTCWSQKTATFLAMGKTCTRACGFCEIGFSPKPTPLDPEEPLRIALSVQQLGLKHAVITMVARDDLADGGASHLVAIIEAIRKETPSTTIEVLSSDLAGNAEALACVLEAKPEIFNHNIETVRRLTPRVRHKATYERTLQVLQQAKHCSHKTWIKSGLMVGLGENDDEVKETLNDLHHVGCHIATIGHYLQASNRKLRVKSFVTPEQFQGYADYGHSIGIRHVYSAPFVRSSYNAAALFNQLQSATCHA